jgi:flagellar motor switch/type III secretory pathway protein FliN
LLEEDEVAAIRAAMTQSAAAPSDARAIDLAQASTAASAAAVALIAEDRAASHARPNAIRLATRWARSAARLLVRQGLKVEVHILGAEIVDGTALRDELARCALQAVQGQGRPSPLVIAVSGRVIEASAARILGAEPTVPSNADRPPSAVAMSLFQPTAVALARTLAEAWDEEQSCKAAPIADPAAVSRAVAEVTSGVAVSVTLGIVGPTSGQLRFLARPETLFVAPAPADAVPVAAGVIDDILGGVKVDLAVELGTARLTMRELAALKPGSIIALDRFVDDRLPIRCQGVVVAQGRAMVALNNMAVEIVGGPGEGRGNS